MYDILYNNLHYIIASMSLIFLLMFVLIIILFAKISKNNKRLEKFLSSNDEFSIEKMIKEYLGKIEEVEAQNSGIKKDIATINSKLKTAVQKVALVRYNPFEDTGGDLCYALALLDEDDNGVLLNSIYSREGSYNYAKDITKGESKKHKISKEEQQAIEAAMNSRNI